MGASELAVLTQLKGKPKNIINGFSTNGYSVFAIESDNNTSAKKLLSGSLTANVLSTILSITGQGSLKYLTVTTEDATSRTVRAKLTLDGVVVFDSTSAAIAITNRGAIIVGSILGGVTAVPFVFDDIRFYSSCLLEVASSLTETNLIKSKIVYTA